MPLFLMSSRPRRSRVLPVLLLVGGVSALFVLQRGLRLPPPAVVEVTSDRPAVGRKSMFTVRVREPKLALSQVVVTGDGAGLAREVLAQVTVPPGETRREVVLQIPLGPAVRPAMRPGKVTVQVVAQARGTWLRTPAPVMVAVSREVRLQPPAITAQSPHIHVAHGGAEVVVYQVGPTSKRDGVQAGKWFFPGFPRPGGRSDERFALFGVPYDLEGNESEARARILLVAEDELGNRAETPFVHQFRSRPMGRDTIELTDGFMKKVTDEVYARTPGLSRRGDLLADYLRLNRELREANMAQLVALARASQPRFLWTETFLPMSRAAVTGSFADRRSYRSAGKEVDSQDHLGIDLASLKQAAVPAANDGRVVLADYFGIFGICVVLDHGYGLMSLYAHLSSAAVKVGESVKRGQDIGRTGGTGLAGGDHLHFTMLVQGLPVTPFEWWDSHWIHDRLKLKLGHSLAWNPRPGE
jgi:murein DD-endopeptidase MepM/ murein hydrolase activator NlpD